MSKGKIYIFQYVKPFSCYYLYILSVDDHNDMHHDGRMNYQVLFDSLWITHRWETRLFALSYHAKVFFVFCLNYFLKKYKEIIVLILILSHILIHNK